MNRALLVLALGVVAFAVALAIYVGNHLSNEAMAVLTGTVCGAGAMLPAAIMGTMALLRRRDEDKDEAPAQPAHPPYAQPPVIVVAPPAAPQALPPGTPAWQGNYPPGYGMPSSGRQFSVIGDEEGGWNDERRSSR